MSFENTMLAYLDYLDANNFPHRIEIRANEFLIGRAHGNDLRIEDTRISRNHAEIICFEKEKHLFRDKDSKCGSFINDIKVKDKILEIGDVITLGGINTTKLVFGYMPKNSDGVESMVTTSNLLPKLKAFYIQNNTTVITDQQTRFLNADLMQKPEYISNRTLGHLTALYQISHKLLPAKNILELSEVWLEQLFKALPIERGAIFLFNQPKGQLELITCRSRNQEKIDNLQSNNLIVEHTFQNNVAIHTDSTTSMEFLIKDKEFSKNVGSSLSAPISSSLRVWGVCYLDSFKASDLNSEDLEFLMATAREAGLVIENLQLQEQLVKAERLATIGKLTSGISHEIRNRLSLLTGIEFIEMKYGDDPDVKLFAEMVKMGQQRALALVDEIRAFARNQNEEFQKTLLPIVKTIEKALSILKLDPSAMRRTIDFYYDCQPNIAFNEAKIEQVIINLVRNAIEATPENSGRIIINLTTSDKEVIIQIFDNGSGIPVDVLEHIWDPFFTTKGEDGTGLGLEICRRIIEAHGGQITCESLTSEGTTFTVKLPLGKFIE